MLKRLFLILFLSSFTLNAMQSPTKVTPLKSSSLDRLPNDVKAIVIQMIGTAATLDDAIAGIKRFYIASPKSRNDIQTMKSILSYIGEKFSISGKQLEEIVQKLQKLENFPVFKNPELSKWISIQIGRLNKEKELVKAVEALDVEKVKQLLEEKVNPNYTDSGDSMLLAVSGRTRRERASDDIASSLIDAGADLNYKNKFDKTPLGSAAAAGRTHLVQMLLNKKADPNKTNPLWHAIVGLKSLRDPLQKNQVSAYKTIITLLLNAGAKPISPKGVSIKSFVNDAPLLSPEEKNELLELLATKGLEE